MLVLDACGKWGSSLWTTNMTSTLRERADPSSRAKSTNRRTSSCIAGPRNWQPLARTAAQRLADSCCGFWCCRMSSVTVRSPRLRAARTALARPSCSASWHVMSVTNLRCIGLDRSGLPPLTRRKRAKSSTQRRHDRYNCHSSLSSEERSVDCTWTSSSMDWSSSVIVECSSPSCCCCWWWVTTPLLTIDVDPMSCRRAVLTGNSSASMLTLLWSNGHCLLCSLHRHVCKIQKYKYNSDFITLILKIIVYLA